MKAKKIIATLLVLAMGTSLLTACKQETPVTTKNDPTVNTTPVQIEEPIDQPTICPPNPNEPIVDPVVIEGTLVDKTELSNKASVSEGIVYCTPENDIVFIGINNAFVFADKGTEIPKEMWNKVYSRLYLDVDSNEFYLEVIVDKDPTVEEHAEFEKRVDKAILMGYSVYVEEPVEPSTQAQTQYAVLTKLFDNLTTDDKNVIFSPLSLNYALGMASNTVADEFAKEFESYFGMTIAEYNEFCKQYIEARKDGMEIANSIWINDKYTADEDTANLLIDKYAAELNSRAFDKAFVDEVNNWCKEKTHDKIQKIISDVPGPEMVSYLINALYFKQDWIIPYDEFQVGETQFKTADGEVTITGMNERNDMLYLENDKATGFMKPYENGYAFVGILPKAEREFTLSELDIESLMNSRTSRDVITMIPKFKFETSLNELMDDLKVIGLDLEPMLVDKLANEDRELAFSSVIQKAMIDVNESGTTAAAVTSIGVKCTSAIDIKEPEQVILDRPFAFMIYDTENDVVLFMGKVENPNI